MPHDPAGWVARPSGQTWQGLSRALVGWGWSTGEQATRSPAQRASVGLAHHEWSHLAVRGRAWTHSEPRRAGQHALERAVVSVGRYGPVNGLGGGL